MANSQWLECRLADACGSIDYGLTASATDIDTGPRFLRITDIVGGSIDWNSVPHVVADQATSAKYRLDDGDIVIARTGASTGTSAYVKNPPPAVFASYLVRLKAKEEFDSRFLAYYLKSDAFWAFIRGVLGDKSAQPNASASTMTQAPLRAPRSIGTQRAIAHILGTLDDKIELNRRTNETLESIARALFRSWFVDFDPVRAKAEGRDPGLPQELADLFPDSLEDSELGEIPAGWRAATLGEIATNPRRPVRPSEIDPTTPYIGLEHMPRNSIALADWGTAETLESGKAEFRRGEILFGKLRPYFHKVGIAPVDGVCSTDIVVVAPRGDAWFGFVLGHVSSDAFVEHTNAGSTGTKMPRTSWADMAHYPVGLPPAALAAALTSRIGPVVARIVSSIHEARVLGVLRDTLLPRLVSGELPVMNAERAMEVVP